MMARFTSILTLLLLIIPSFAFTSSRIVSARPKQPPTTSARSALLPLDPSFTLVTSDILTQDSIHQAFSVATFLPQPFWLLLIFIPNTGITKKIMGGMVCASCLPKYATQARTLLSYTTALWIIASSNDMCTGSFLYCRRVHCSARWQCSACRVCRCV